MNSELNDTRPAVAEEGSNQLDGDEMADTVVLTETEFTDNVGDASVEINVEELIADVEKDGDQASPRKKEVRRRLEELAESQSVEDTFAIDFDDD